MPLDYSKWDAIELSDDEDIEVHPNVDKRSFIKWNREAIHKRRAERKEKIATLKERIVFCDQVIGKVNELINAVDEGEMDKIGSLFEEISIKGVKQSKQEQPTVEQSLAGLLTHVQNEIKTSGQQMNKQLLKEKLNEELKKVEEHKQLTSEELRKEEKIENNTLTSDNICKPGFDKTIVSQEEKPPVLSSSKPKKEKVIEVLNPKTLTTTKTTLDKVVEPQVEEEEEDIEASEIAIEFSKQKTPAQSLEFISKYRFIIDEKYSDEILALAFDHQLKGDSKNAKHCVNQALIIQYCNRLGKDGVSAFFNRMGEKGNEVFTKDVNDTYNILKERCKVINANRQQEQKAIFQLEPTSKDAKIVVDLPTDDSQDQERKKIFEQLPINLQEAFKKNNLDDINLALGELDEHTAEHALQLCDQGGFLNFMVPEEAIENDNTTLIKE